MVALDVPSQHHKVMALFYRDWPHFLVEAHQQHSPNVIIFQLVMGDWGCFIVVCYLSLKDASSIYCVVRDVVQFPHGSELMVVGDFNTDIK